MTFSLIHPTKSNVMNMSFKCVIALIAVLSLQGLIQAKNVPIQPTIQHQTILKAATNARTSITELSVNSISEVKHTADQIRNIGQQQYNRFMSNLEQLKQETLVELNAPFEGIDITACVQDAVPRVVALVEQAQAGISECFAAFLAAFIEFYETVLEAASRGYDNIYALMIKYDECENWQCRGAVAKELTQETMRISGEVRIIIDRALREMSALVPAVNDCMQNQSAIIKAELEAIVIEYKECVAELVEK